MSDEEKTAFSDTKQKDLELWEAWKASGEDPHMMRPLMKQMDPLIKHRASQYAQNSHLGKKTLEVEFKRQFINAAKTYDPEKGPLATHAEWHFKKVYSDFVAPNQGMGHVPLARQLMTKDYNTAVAVLGDQYGRNPTDAEVAEHMKIHPNEVARLRAESRGELGTAGSPDDYMFMVQNPHVETLNLLHYELSPDEKVVWEYLMGAGGKPHISSTGQIARVLGWSDSKVSRLKAAIQQKAKQYM